MIIALFRFFALHIPSSILFIIRIVLHFFFSFKSVAIFLPLLVVSNKNGNDSNRKIVTIQIQKSLRSKPDWDKIRIIKKKKTKMRYRRHKLYFFNVAEKKASQELFIYFGVHFNIIYKNSLKYANSNRILH